VRSLHQHLEARANGVGEIGVDWLGNDIVIEAVEDPDVKSYSGFVAVEQERDPCTSGGSLGDVKQSRDYLESVGF
jgi:catabolite regulation protein CreA